MLVQHKASEGEGSTIPPESQPTFSTSQQPTSGIDTSGRLRRQETIRGTSAQTRFERVLKQPNEPPLIEGHTSGRREGRLEENTKLMDTVPTPYDSPLTGEPQIPASHIIFPDAPAEHILQSPTTYQQKRNTQTYKRTQKDTELPQTSVPLNLGANEAVNQDEVDRVERAIATDASLEVAQDSDNITKTQTMTIPNVDIPYGIDTSGRSGAKKP
nr:hypothetical protein [Tanacetum cinerariifolium]